jgi:tetratricopeptide (TPR) repeat protein
LPFALVPIPRKDYERQLERLNLATAESDAWLAEYHLRFKRTAEAKVLIDAALAENPDLALGHEAMGTYDILLGDYRNALKEFSAATAADPSLFSSATGRPRPTFQKAVSAIYAARQNLLPDTRPPLWLSPGCW